MDLYNRARADSYLFLAIDTADSRNILYTMSTEKYMRANCDVQVDEQNHRQSYQLTQYPVLANAIMQGYTKVASYRKFK